MTKILILSNPVDDKHVPRLVAELEQLGHPWAIFDPGDILDSARVTASIRSERRHTVLSLADGTQIVLEDITSVWYRRPTRILPRDDKPGMEQTFIQREANAGIWGLLRGLQHAFWVNAPDAVRSAGHKPEQLQRAAALGLSIPRSLVTNEPEAFRRFYEECHGSVIYKLMGYPWYVDKNELPVSAYTSLVPQEMVEREAHRITATTHLFQEFVVKKCDIRVTIIGQDVFATEIHPLSEETRIDFRADYSKLSHAPHTLPEQLREQLLTLTRSYHLTYAGIDLLLTPDDRYVYLELNALGQFGWLENRTGIPLYRTLANMLVKGKTV